MIATRTTVNSRDRATTPASAKYHSDGPGDSPEQQVTKINTLEQAMTSRGSHSAKLLNRMLMIINIALLAHYFYCLKIC